jgi:hypothetical protein
MVEESELVASMRRSGLVDLNATQTTYPAVMSDLLLNFVSPYGVYTPITVRSYSIAKHANLERD